MHRPLAWLRPLLGLTLGALLSVTCGPPGPPVGDCRYNPDCGGGLGGFCDRDSECGSGYCCERKECDHGMCTFDCDSDPECPAGMLCQHDTCFFSCNNHGDCARGQKCKHGRVCEWD